MNDETEDGALEPIENRKSEIEHRQASDLTIAIMAGGRSRRMGRDKALIPVGGVPMLERVARAALGTGLPVIVIGRERPADWPFDEVAFHLDRYPDTGPLGGLATALQVSGTSVLMLACDMPLVTTDAIGWLIKQGGMADGYGVVPSSGGRLEPLFAIYRISVLPRVASMFEQEIYALKGLINAVRFCQVEWPAWVQGECINVNDAREVEKVNRNL
jgi:molybdenum cofactor guanylyltransferase